MIGEAQWHSQQPDALYRQVGAGRLKARPCTAPTPDVRTGPACALTTSRYRRPISRRYVAVREAWRADLNLGTGRSECGVVRDSAAAAKAVPTASSGAGRVTSPAMPTPRSRSRRSAGRPARHLASALIPGAACGRRHLKGGNASASRTRTFSKTNWTDLRIEGPGQ